MNRSRVLLSRKQFYLHKKNWIQLTYLKAWRTSRQKLGTIQMETAQQLLENFETYRGDRSLLQAEQFLNQKFKHFLNIR